MPGSPYYSERAAESLGIMPTPVLSCRDCVHSGEAEQGTILVCIWEKNFLPPPVFRARLWGQNPPQTRPRNAEKCSKYEAKL